MNKISVEITQTDEQVRLLFSTNGGAFGTDEVLDEHVVSPKELLDILQLFSINNK